MKRYLMTFSYDGTLVNGYQKQLNGRTIQNEIEKALLKICNKKTTIVATGRTDAKVHALNQKAHFEIEMDITPSKLKQALNSLMPNDIYIKSIIVVDNSFHARYSVKSKEYVYKINMNEYNPIERNYVYQYNKNLNLKEIKRSFKYLIGEHNFKSFSKTDETKEDYVRTIYKITVKNDSGLLTFTIKGTGFFRYMIRNIMGTLIEIGEGKRSSKDIIDILKAQDRRKAGKTAPPEGLYLKDIYY